MYFLKFAHVRVKTLKMNLIKISKNLIYIQMITNRNIDGFIIAENKKAVECNIRRLF